MHTLSNIRALNEGRLQVPGAAEIAARTAAILTDAELLAEVKRRGLKLDD